MAARDGTAITMRNWLIIVVAGGIYRLVGAYIPYLI
jgi:hypothetical protein